jgi:hypothetical protein
MNPNNLRIGANIEPNRFKQSLCSGAKQLSDWKFCAWSLARPAIENTEVLSSPIFEIF